MHARLWTYKLNRKIATSAIAETNHMKAGSVQIARLVIPPKDGNLPSSIMLFLYSSSKANTLNYNIRILGRRGVLVLNAVANMEQIAAIRIETQGVLSAVDFNEGHRYTDYLPGKDKAATYGIAGLIAGAAAAKAGLFKLLWVGILAFKKVILVGVIALGAFLKRLIAGRSAKTAAAGAAQDGGTSPT
jgi:hypothetical protein